MQTNTTIQDAVHNIMTDVEAVQVAISGQCIVPGAVLRSLHNIQIQAKALLVTDHEAEPEEDGPISQGYRLDLQDTLMGLAEALFPKITMDDDGVTHPRMTPLGPERSYTDLRLLSLAAEATHQRIDNYLRVKRMENFAQQREEFYAGRLGQPAA